MTARPTVYPSPDDYTRAVQHPDSFTTDELRRASFTVHPVWRIPKPASGTSAVVFRTVLDGRDQAMRFFIRPDASSADRYRALQEHFTARDLLGCVAGSQWLDDAIRVNGHTWPVLRMQWVNGVALNRHVEQLVEDGDTQALGELAQRWRELVRRLQQAEFAHGDLQHGNVLVDERGALRLVDFDSSWIARFAGQPAPTETGHRNYQPEGRVWGPWMDTFPGLVVYTSLVALSKNPHPWAALDTGENMLFSQEDFAPPHETPAWQHVSSIGDPTLEQLADQLRECCKPGWTATGGLEELLVPPWWLRTRRDVHRPSPTPRPPLPSPPPPLPAPVPTPTPAEWWKPPTTEQRPPGTTEPVPATPARRSHPVVVAVIIVAVVVLLVVVAVLAAG